MESPQAVGSPSSFFDGPANGGDFAAKTVDIEFTEAERTAKGDGDWDQGAFAKSGVDIALEEKE